MGEQDGPAVGSVSEEAARLLEALGGWASTAHDAYAAKPASQRAADQATDSGADHAAGSPGESRSRCDSCGAHNGMGQAVTCQLCPVCQGITLLRAVRPETVDRLADLAGAAAQALRDIASARRATAPSSSAGGAPGRSGHVQDIPVADDDNAPAAHEPGSVSS